MFGHSLGESFLRSPYALTCSPLCILSPFSRFGIIPVGGRSTAIKLSNGDVWVMASTPLTTETKAKLNELGPVKFVFTPYHYDFDASW